MLNPPVRPTSLVLGPAPDGAPLLARETEGVTTSAGLRPIRVGRAVTTFLVTGLVVLTILALVLAVSQRQQATAEAIRDARTLTNLEATDVIGPLLTDDALEPGPARDRLDAVVRDRVLGSHIVRVKVWDSTGTIRYSDDRALIGVHFGLPADELEALRTGRTKAEVSDLNAAENRDETRFGKLLQVYQGVRTATGTRLLFETYQPYSVITVASRRLWMSSLPVLLGGLVLLYLVQAPLAYRMASRLRTAQDERESLLLATLAASDRERATIAADLHDGIVQGLAGASYTLDATPTPAVARTTAADLRRWVRELRSLVVTITPPALHAQGLATSLADLGATLELRGVDVTVEVDDVHLPEAVESLVYRTAQEAVRNVVRHASASHVSLSLTGSPLMLTVTDDGVGIETGDSPRRRGSVGLELLTALAEAQGGTLTVTGAPGAGTTLRLEVP
ncbi:MAG: two-component system, NarL family, sensor kinase [Frankiales bacterium]|nr:two-component system, NarL family, sensor kinase [Frankiales bacterium]